MSKGVIEILEPDEVIRLATGECLGKLVDIGDKFVFKPNPDEQLSTEEEKQIALFVEIFNDRSVGDFWQKREAEIEASLSHLDPETRAAQRALKAIFGSDYLTEEEVRRSVSGLHGKFADALVELWKQGKMVSRGRNEYGEIIWAAQGGKLNEHSTQ